MGARGICGGLAALMALLGAAAPAGAAVASTHEVCESGNKGRCAVHIEIDYVAAPGELNAVTVTQGENGFTISDTVAIEARGQCRQETPARVACPGRSLHAQLGDGADSGSAGPATPAVSLDGEAGADVLDAPLGDVDGGDGDDRVSGASAQGGGGRDTVTGTSARNFLGGGPGVDVVRGEDGADVLDGGDDHDSDLIDGGSGVDAVSYSQRREPVEVDIAEQTGGYPGEADRLVSIDSAFGGLAGDRLVGDEGPNTLAGNLGSEHELHGAIPGDVLVGAGGDDALHGGFNSSELYGGKGDDTLNAGTGGGDLLDGGAGNDRLGGGFGPDRLRAGEGDDVLFVGHGHRSSPAGPSDEIGCGAGADIVDQPTLTLLGPDCEAVRRVHFRSPAYPLMVSEREVVLPVHCPRARPRCRGEVRLRLGGERQPFAVRAFKRRHGRARVRLRIPARVAARAASGGPLRMRVSVRLYQRVPGLFGREFAERWVVDLAAVLRPGVGDAP